MAITERYVATDGDNTDAQATYDAATSLANACSLTVAVKYAVAGDRVNIKNGNKAGASAEYTLGADLTLVNDGSVTAPIIYRGYNSTIGDLEAVTRTNGNGDLEVTSFPKISAGVYRILFNLRSYINLQTLYIEGSRTSAQTAVGAHCTLDACRCDNTSTNASAVCVTALNVGATFSRCDMFHTGGSGSSECLTIMNNNVTVHACRFKGKGKGIYVSGNRTNLLINKCQFVSMGGIAIDASGYTSTVPYHQFIGNTIYGANGGGIVTANGDVVGATRVIDNHITDNAGYAISNAYAGTSAVAALFLCNRTRDNSSGAISGFGDYPTIGHVTTDTGGAETDYVDAASGDLSLIPAAPGKGVSSMPYRDIGAVQAASGASPVFGDRTGGIR